MDTQILPMGQETHPSLSFPGCNVVPLPTTRPREILGSARARLLPPSPPLYSIEPGLTVTRLRHGRLQRERGQFWGEESFPHSRWFIPDCKRALPFKRALSVAVAVTASCSQCPFISSKKIKPQVLSWVHDYPEYNAQPNLQ